ncbi:urease accessory protein UreF [Corallococcus praedator]|uniref:Urease accessory protein UreF n=1 Tax=Corallococcus praedator TaxID=2316724 RepID=A0ABX9Q6Y7_9BACT|nr:MULTISPECIES: urease accessory UreF family protein [Corallococcus]RKG98703.1 urease accessory protein UreF [Corallococcus sp. CA047B]RKH17995.1 urease accessory protein UreF [Corallococcus sp. CA031C]RKH91039.1 urease accessory protein UreF [Corallococcus praedator]
MGTGWRVLQLADSGFPTGGFAHSGGLEAAVQQGEVRGAGDVRRFVEALLWQAGLGGLPLVNAGWREPASLPAWDARADVFLSNHVAHRASRTQGRAFLDTCARIFPDAVGPVREAARAAGVKFHHAPLFGAVLRALEVDLEDAQRLFLSLTLRGALSAGVRMGVIGTHESHQVQHGATPLLDAVLTHCSALGVEDLAQPAPLLDLLGASHDRLYSRLFLS